MAPRYKTPEQYYNEIEANRAELTPPENKAVFYTNGAQTNGIKYARSTNSNTLEGLRENQLRDGEYVGQYGTPYGSKLDQDNLFDLSDPKTVEFNMQAAGFQQNAKFSDANSLNGKFNRGSTPTSGAQKVWEKTSLTYAEQASGKVEVMTNGAPPNERGVFARVECEALIRNDKVTQINGIPRQDLEKQLDSAKTTDERKAAFDDINKQIGKADEIRKERMVKEKQAQVETPAPKQTVLSWEQRQKSLDKAQMEKPTGPKTKN